VVNNCKNGDISIIKINHPMGNPNKMQKIGTPIPMAMQNKSRIIKIIKIIFIFSLKILLIFPLPK